MLIGTVLLFAYIFSLPDGKLHIFFCNVGQGDAVYIRTPSNQDMLIDGGPDDKVLTCLGRHMPFYDRTIDVVVLTHPQKDHLQGLISVLLRYTVKYFVIGVVGNKTEGYKLLIDTAQKKNIAVRNLYRGDKFSLGNAEFDVLWPQREWVAGASTDTQLNDFSYFLDLKYGAFNALFPGDGDIHIQPDIMRLGDLPKVTVLKYPHHGSKTAVTREFLDKIRPDLAVISVGKNPYGHPTKEALNLLENIGVRVKRTDVSGDIEITSDGRNWKVN